MLLDRSGDFTVVGGAENGMEAVPLCGDTARTLMGMGLPGLNGVDTTTELLGHSPAEDHALDVR